MTALGRHLIVEYYDCDEQLINDVPYVERCMEQAAEAAGATIVNSTFHHFSPHGVSGVVVIEESHLAVHTWPEYGHASVDLFTCGEAVNPWVACAELKNHFKAARISATELSRAERLLPEEKKRDINALRGQNSNE